MIILEITFYTLTKQIFCTMLVVDNCQNVSLTTTKPGVMTGDELLNAIFNNSFDDKITHF